MSSLLSIRLPRWVSQWLNNKVGHQPSTGMSRLDLAKMAVESLTKGLNKRAMEHNVQLQQETTNIQKSLHNLGLGFCQQDQFLLLSTGRQYADQPATAAWRSRRPITCWVRRLLSGTVPWEVVARWMALAIVVVNSKRRSFILKTTVVLSGSSNDCKRQFGSQTAPRKLRLELNRSDCHFPKMVVEQQG